MYRLYLNEDIIINLLEVLKTNLTDTELIKYTSDKVMNLYYELDEYIYSELRHKSYCYLDDLRFDLLCDLRAHDSIETQSAIDLSTKYITPDLIVREFI